MRYALFIGILATFMCASHAYAFDSATASKQALKAWKNPLKQDLEKKGFIDYSVSKPYRVAVPITTLGSERSKLMLTYTPNPSEVTNGKGWLLFAKIPLH